MANEYTISKIKLPNGDICNLKDTWRSISDAVNSTSSDVSASSKAVKTAYDLADGKVSKSGDTMTGQLLTSFKNSVATGSLVATSTTIPDLCEELRYSSGCMGSFQLTTVYTLNNVTINNGWYNFIWVPHRSGGANGASNGDNVNYGTCYLSAMDNTYAYFVLRFTRGEITELLRTAEFVSNPTANQVVVAYDAKGRVKTSGYTIAANVPSDAVFTDTKVAQTASTTTNWRKVILGYNQDTSSTTDVAGVTEQVYGSKYISAQPSTGTLRANIYRVEDKVELQWNETDQSLDFVFI